MIGRLGWARGLVLAAIGAFAVMAAPPGCAADDLNDALSGGECKDGKCADGYYCEVSTNTCRPDGYDAGTDGSGGTTGDADPCANCSASETCCDGQCVNLQTNSSHCGSCNAPCPGTTCANGSCTNECKFGSLDCDGNKANGCEAEIATDPLNCGNCNAPCSAPTDGTPTCTGGLCEFDCGSLARCGQECIDTTDDPKNCGACATECPSVENGSATCAAGACGASCDPGFVACASGSDVACVDTASDPSNCGACGTKCETGKVCDGVCADSCSGGKTQCGSSCVNTQSNVQHCGACDSPCPAADNGVASCSNGGCVVTCNSGFFQCGSACVDTQTDADNCGACGKACSVPTNGTAQCTAGACGFSCDQGYAKCGSACSDTKTDPNNCGSCGNACGATEVCSNGVCTSSCSSGQVNCSGSCVDPQTDTKNCGSCGTACAGDPNGQATCAAGQCGVTCNAGYKLCGGVCKNIQSDVTNCGECGTTCSAPAGGTAVCNSGSCDFTCTGTLTKCGSSCVNTQTNPQFCGSCNTACTTGQVCASGTCTVDCGTLTNCSGQCVSTQTDPQNCGVCDNQCTPPSDATATCNGGACGFTCNSGYAKCGSATECFNINTDPLHCGTGCVDCPEPTGGNGVSKCTSGTCGITCDGGYTLCSGACVSTSSDPNNCGGCGVVCGAGKVCSNGVCTLDCGTKKNCSGQCVDTLTDVDNCGSCGNACPHKPLSTRTCVAGICGYACVGGASIVDCNPTAKDGCENTLLDTRHCGQCNRACSTTNVMSALCFDGVCGSSCALGHSNCGKPSAPLPDNGCEEVYSNVACGSCGSKCSSLGVGGTGGTGGTGGSGATGGGGGVASGDFLTCQPGSLVGACGCDSAKDCNPTGAAGAATCIMTAGQCQNCTGNDEKCNPGEVCAQYTVGISGPTVLGCSCSGDDPCPAGSTCCPKIGNQTTTNCRNLTSDPQNCAACGRMCPPGFTCSGSLCKCDSVTDCSAGSQGSVSCITSSGDFNRGKCICNGTTCAYGQRCQPGGNCG